MKKVLFILIVFLIGNKVYSQDELFIPKIEKESVVKVKKYEYKIVKIGDDWWFAENFKYKPKDVTETVDNNNEKLCVYTYEQAEKYCPKGWHIPSDEEWFKLEENLGMEKKNLKNPLRSLYFSPALEAMNFIKHIAEANSIAVRLKYPVFWTSTELSPKEYVQARILQKMIGYENRAIYIKRFGVSKKIAFSVRYIKNK